MLIASLVAATFLVLALVHVYWAAGGQWGIEAAIPKLPVAPDLAASAGVRAAMVKAFNPGPATTLLVAGGLALISLLVALRAGVLADPVDHWALQGSIAALAVVMLVRAIGDFRLVGFFKTVTGSQFARMDSMYYSPLCVLLGLGLGLVAA